MTEQQYLLRKPKKQDNIKEKKEKKQKLQINTYKLETNNHQIIFTPHKIQDQNPKENDIATPSLTNRTPLKSQQQVQACQNSLVQKQIQVNGNQSERKKYTNTAMQQIMQTLLRTNLREQKLKEVCSKMFNSNKKTTKIVKEATKKSLMKNPSQPNIQAANQRQISQKTPESTTQVTPSRVRIAAQTQKTQTPLSKSKILSDKSLMQGQKEVDKSKTDLKNSNTPLKTGRDIKIAKIQSRTTEITPTRSKFTITQNQTPIKSKNCDYNDKNTEVIKKTLTPNQTTSIKKLKQQKVKKPSQDKTPIKKTPERTPTRKIVLKSTKAAEKVLQVDLSKLKFIAPKSTKGIGQQIQNSKNGKVK